MRSYLVNRMNAYLCMYGAFNRVRIFRKFDGGNLIYL